ncbi:hypothetical protein BBBOND_0400780 [Babesia bigemina]|uniref:Uncharacterized protein n=1 Tax=Babesia bigemina TaxID=5866 RepID=A0A061DA39_BABBI|nr:hypothetical protein BBBOND_0400780 [Babesia bigemina]CDR97586.1 hypothetical protein BBBOND_0400780 [Babesia bigemina]|eukprot:XP_012769772.1 hypothetical protein BBBOND_0400780 [Babesia bigemina]
MKSANSRHKERMRSANSRHKERMKSANSGHKERMRSANSRYKERMKAAHSRDILASEEAGRGGGKDDSRAAGSGAGKDDSEAGYKDKCRKTLRKVRKSIKKIFRLGSEYDRNSSSTSESCGCRNMEDVITHTADYAKYITKCLKHIEENADRLIHFGPPPKKHHSERDKNDNAREDVEQSSNDTFSAGSEDGTEDLPPEEDHNS